MKPFTKLFSSIISSSIWRSPKETKVVWITMLAMSDKDGEVWASVGGLADMARVTKEECRKALDELLAPDDDSRTKGNEGRRIEEVDGGWRVLNYKKYREMGRGEDRREYFAENKRVNRAKQAECPQKSTMSTPCPPLSPIAEAEAEADKREREETRAPAPLSKKEWERQILERMGALTRKDGNCIMAEWSAETKGLKADRIAAIFMEATPGILWPSQFKVHRAAKGNY